MHLSYSSKQQGSKIKSEKISQCKTVSNKVFNKASRTPSIHIELPSIDKTEKKVSTSLFPTTKHMPATTSISKKTKTNSQRKSCLSSKRHEIKSVTNKSEKTVLDRNYNSFQDCELDEVFADAAPCICKNQNISIDYDTSFSSEKYDTYPEEFYPSLQNDGNNQAREEIWFCESGFYW